MGVSSGSSTVSSPKPAVPVPRSAVDTLGLAFRLARRELRGGLRGLRVFWLCLTLGVAVIAAVGALSQSVMAGLHGNARSLLGGDASIRLHHREATPEQYAHLASGTTVSQVVTTRTMMRTPDNAARRLVELKAVDGAYPLYGQINLAPPLELHAALARDAQDRWGLVADGGVLDLLGVAVGDEVQLGRAIFQVRARIAREPDRTGRSMLLGATAVVATESLPATDLVKPGSLVAYHYRVRLRPDTDVAQWTAGLQRAFPDAGWRVQTFENATPRVERFVEYLTDFLRLVGLTALLVGGVGVSNAIASYLRGKVRTIATLKCLGAPARLVFQTYLIQTMLLASTGVICGVAIGAAAPFLAGRFLADALAVPVAVGVFPGPLLLAAAYGLLTALVFSIWPLAAVRDVPAAGIFRSIVMHTGRLPPVRFIAVAACGAGLLMVLAVFTTDDRTDAVWFIAGALVTLALFYGAGRLATLAARAAGRPKRADLRLALTNLYRPGAPTGNVVLSLGLGLTVIIAIALVEGNLSRRVADSLPAAAPNFFFIDIRPDQVAAFDALVRATPGKVKLERVPMLRGRITGIAGRPVEEVNVGEGSRWAVEGDRQLTWSRTPPAQGEIIAGTWWAEDYDGPPLISLEHEIARDFGVDVGDTLTFNILGRSFQATIANLRRVHWESMSINFAVVFAPGFLETVPHSHMATARVDAVHEAALERAVSEQFPNISAVRLKAFIGTALDLLRQIGMTVRLVAGVAILSGVLVLGSAIATEHRRRVYDSVVLKVLGATRADILRAYAIEYGLLGLMTVLIAGGMGCLVSYAVVTEMMNTEWVFLPRALVVTGLLAVGLTLSAGLVGTWRALAHPAGQILRNE